MPGLLPLLLAAAVSPLAGARETAFQQLVDAAPQASPALPPAVPATVDRTPPACRPAEGIGLSHSGDPFDIPDFSLAEIAGLMKENGATHYRPHLPLNEAVPELTPAVLAKLREAVKEPRILDELIEDLAKNGRWSRMDGLVDTFTGAGLELVLVVGAGYRKEAPLFTAANGSKLPASPDRLGRDVYIAMARWLAGAGARRYGGKVRVWQVENEINLASMVSLIGWRVAERSWTDKKFLADLLAALSETVHAEGARAGRELKTTHNFAAGMVGWQNIDLGEDIASLRAGHLDIVGVDVYANYFAGYPLGDGEVGKVVAQAARAAGGRPVWVLETGFPRAPGSRGFSEARQGEYFRKSFDAAYRAGAAVVLAFGWFWNPTGWYTDNPSPKPWWHPQATEQYWSPIEVRRHPDGTRGETTFGSAWSEFKSAAACWTSR